MQGQSRLAETIRRWANSSNWVAELLGTAKFDGSVYVLCTRGDDQVVVRVLRDSSFRACEFVEDADLFVVWPGERTQRLNALKLRLEHGRAPWRFTLRGVRVPGPAWSAALN